MKLYREQYKNADGQTVTKKRWYLDFFDYYNRRHRLAGFTSKAATEQLGRQIETLISYRTAGQSLPRELQIWIDGLPDSLIKNLVSWGLIDSQRAEAGKPLSSHLIDWKNSLATHGTAKHADQQYNRVQRVFIVCGFKSYQDIKPSKLEFAISRMNKQTSRTVQGKPDHKDTGHQLSQKSQAYILKACQSFCRWMVQDGRASQNPLANLKPGKVAQTIQRAAFSSDELAYLISYTETAPVRYSLTGPQRAMLYMLAAQTGLRANEIRSLTVDCFDFKSLTIKLSGKHTKNSDDCELPLRAETAELFREYFSNKLPQAKAFDKLTAKTSDMIHLDMTEARELYQQQTGDYDSNFLSENIGAGERNFHSLRHTFATELARAGVHPKTAQDLLRHSDINLTMSRYTHSIKEQQNSAIEQLPDLTKQPDFNQQRATGTEGENIDAISEKSAGSSAVKMQTKLCNSLQNNAKVEGSDQTKKNPVSEPKSSISGQKQGLSDLRHLGLEPKTHGLRVRCTKDITADKSKSYKTGEKSAGSSAGKKDIFTPDLQQIIDRWNDLPEHIKAVIMTLIKA